LASSPQRSRQDTLLSVINGIIKPDKGSIRIAGRVGGLIALGAGFNPVLTVERTFMSMQPS